MKLNYTYTMKDKDDYSLIRYQKIGDTINRNEHPSLLQHLNKLTQNKFPFDAAQSQGRDFSCKNKYLKRGKVWMHFMVNYTV